MKNAPAYVKVYSRLKNEINKGTYPVGGFLPKECELEKIYQAVVCGKPVDNVGKYVDYLSGQPYYGTECSKDAGAGGTG